MSKMPYRRSPDSAVQFHSLALAAHFFMTQGRRIEVTRLYP